jgi:DNA-binding SARP family transcriptional activator/tetratricopeptide (TPR) repeat protein
MKNGSVMRIRLLGPVDVMVDGEARIVSGLRRKAVLATLALHGGEVVSVSRLVDAVWGETAPSTVRNTLQSHVSYLRTLLGNKNAIVGRPPGYRLDVGDDGTDVWLAERLLRQGAQAADPVRGASDLRAALALWRGRPLADVAGLTWLEEQASRLDLLSERIRRALSEARLAAGEHRQLIGELEQMAAAHPLDEQVFAQLMTALYRSGRQADALAAYQRLRGTLAEELGLVPGQALRDLETAILRQDPSLDPPAPAAAVLVPPAEPAPAFEPAQLPPPVATFAGRGAELASLDAIVPRPQDSAVISVIAGTAGVGKTTLAVHWAHRVAAHFPDGQLYVNLRGFDPAGPAADPSQALRGFLDAFAVPPERIPARLEDQVALYRSLLAGRRVLVVLDNARDAEQVRPLLPASPGCLAVVTSRSHLTGLVAGQGAYPLHLDLLPPGEARELLSRRLGSSRVSREPDAVEEIITGCARLPLALTIAAARAAASPSFPLAAVAADLREAGHVLDPFEVGDAATDVRAVFSCSYWALSDGAARLFRLLGLHPGPDITVGAAASLAGLAPNRVRALLAELARGYLLTEQRPGRYACHDLLRAYAAEQAQQHETEADRRAAVGRYLEHCLYTACTAAAFLDPFFSPAVPDPAPETAASAPATTEEALAWFTAERAGLLAAVSLAAGTGQAGHAWRLAWALSTFLLRRGLWSDHTMASQAGLDAVRAAGDTAGEAHCLLLLGLGYARSGRHPEAVPLLDDALRLLEETDGYGRSRVIAHSSLTWIAELEERYGDMLAHAERALQLSWAARDRSMEIMSLGDVGYCHARLGNYSQAISYCGQALTRSKAAGERSYESASWDSLGYVYHKLSDYRRSVTCYERSLGLAREIADRFNEAAILDRLGDVHSSAGDHDAARWAWIQSLRTFDEIDHPEGDRIRTKLRLAGPRLPVAG